MAGKAKPRRDGKELGENVNGWVWDGDNWARENDGDNGRGNDDDDEGVVPGVDHTENVPVGFINTGDGSEEKPHNIIPEQKW